MDQLTGKFRCRAISTALAALFCSVTLAACNSSKSEQPSAEKSHSAAPAHGAVTFNLPIAEYSFSSADQDLMESARRELANRCIRRLRVSYEVTPISEKISSSDRRYGISNSKEAKAFGYHLPPRQPSPHQQIKITGDAQVALYGTQKGTTGEKSEPIRINGVTVPQGGCRAEADREIETPGKAARGAEAARTISVSSFKDSMTTPEVEQSFREWSSCMKSKGYSYDSPLDSLGDRDFMRDQISQREKDTAISDITCKRKTRLLDRWFQSESKIQKKMIAENISELEKLKKSHEVQMRHVRKVLNTPEG